MSRVRPMPVLVAVLLVTVGALVVRVAALDGTATRAPFTTAFTYQGRALDAGQPANGLCDMRFGLYDDPVAGSAVGAPVEQAGVQVTDGLFSVRLDFGPAAFTAVEQRFLAVEIRCPSGAGNYVLLSPRQELTATPFALYALNAGTAQQVPWSGITGVPSDLGGPDWQNVIVVAKSGGDFTSIQAALDSITGAAETNRFLVWIAPGVYEERVTIPAYVSVRGAARELVIVRSGGAATDVAGATVTMPAFTTLRGLTVENTGGAPFSSGVRVTGAFTGTTETVIEDVSIRCLGSGSCVGLLTDGARITVSQSDVLVAPPAGAPTTATGVHLGGSGLTIATLQGVNITVQQPQSTGEAVGLRAADASRLVYEGGLVTANGGASSVGVSILSTSNETVLRDLRITVGGPQPVTGVLLASSTGRVTLSEASILAVGSSRAVGVGVVGSASALQRVNLQVQSPDSVGVEYKSPFALALHSVDTGHHISDPILGLAPAAGHSGLTFIEIANSRIGGSTRGVTLTASDTALIASSMIQSRSATGGFSCSGAYGLLATPLNTSCQ